MAKRVRKMFGNMPEHVHVLAEKVRFDEDGVAEVSPEAYEVFMQCPGYEEIIEEVIEEIAEEASEEPEEIEKVEEVEEVEEVTSEEHVPLKRVPRVKAK